MTSSQLLVIAATVTDLIAPTGVHDVGDFDNRKSTVYVLLLIHFSIQAKTFINAV